MNASLGKWTLFFRGKIKHYRKLGLTDLCIDLYLLPKAAIQEPFRVLYFRRNLSKQIKFTYQKKNQ